MAKRPKREPLIVDKLHFIQQFIGDARQHDTMPQYRRFPTMRLAAEFIDDVLRPTLGQLATTHYVYWAFGLGDIALVYYSDPRLADRQRHSLKQPKLPVTQ